MKQETITVYDNTMTAVLAAENAELTVRCQLPNIEALTVGEVGQYDMFPVSGDHLTKEQHHQRVKKVAEAAYTIIAGDRTFFCDALDYAADGSLHMRNAYEHNVSHRPALGVRDIVLSGDEKPSSIFAERISQ